MGAPILILGFEPFAGYGVNPSQLVAAELGREPGVVSRVMPVSASRLPPLLSATLAEVAPRAVLGLGLGQPGAIAVERVAVNLCDFRVPDNDGARLIDEPAATGGPAAYFATIPAREIVARLSAAGLPARLSDSAGTFLCNMLLYLTLHAAATRGQPCPAGFIHLPHLPEMGPAEGALPLGEMLRGVRLALELLR
jgi:pyroglutamyl-peptidase